MIGGTMITKEMTIAAIMHTYPQTLPVFKRYNLDCADCQLAEFEALAHGAQVHRVDVEALLAELHDCIGKTCP